MRPLETPKQYSARHLRRSIEAAKRAVMDAQQKLQDFRGAQESYRQLLEAAFVRLDTAWNMAAEVETREARKLELADG